VGRWDYRVIITPQFAILVILYAQRDPRRPEMRHLKKKNEIHYLCCIFIRIALFLSRARANTHARTHTRTHTFYSVYDIFMCIDYLFYCFQ